jgi:hypothetical protein
MCVAAIKLAPAAALARLNKMTLQTDSDALNSLRAFVLRIMFLSELLERPDLTLPTSPSLLRPSFLSFCSFLPLSPPFSPPFSQPGFYQLLRIPFYVRGRNVFALKDA